MNISQSITDKYQRLQETLASCGRVIIAYSGGVDSVFLLKAAVDCLGSDSVLACIGASESLAKSEYKAACDIAEQIGARVEVVHPKEMSNTDYQANTPSRCFYCKSELYDLLNDLAANRNFDVVLCGTNADDLSDFRPGLEAAKKFNIASPLAQAGLTKDDIRLLSKHLGLETWDKPAQPCLASRMVYGQQITPEKLKQIEQGEEFLRTMGLRELRVRHHGNLVRIEVPADKICDLTRDDNRRGIIAFFKNLGFNYVSLDLEGFRSGSANEVL